MGCLLIHVMHIVGGCDAWWSAGNDTAALVHTVKLSLVDRSAALNPPAPPEKSCPGRTYGRPYGYTEFPVEDSVPSSAHTPTALALSSPGGPLGGVLPG